MSEDLIRYDVLAQEALRGVIRKVLTEVARAGLPGEHHFYIAIDTTAPGVSISPRMKAQYPEEITIVLQHQFWDLEVEEEQFSVGLSFSGIPERFVVPFSAIKGFFDPSVQFGLQFEVAGGLVDTDEEEDEEVAETVAAIEEAMEAVSDNDAEAGKGDAGAGEKSPAEPVDVTASVVSLDAFRKKS
ncbi:MAG: ClpXP protease specificity-enhancing factor SspB [Hyphomicrobiales bacterium]